MPRVKAFLDRHVHRFVSKKFMVWIVATVYLGFGILSGEHWVAVSLGYLGMEGFADIATRWKVGRLSND